MKKKLFFAGMAAPALVLGLVLAGCPMDGDDGGDDGAYKVTYNGNGSTGGAVPVDSKVYPSGKTVTAAGNTGRLVKTGLHFFGWNTQADGAGTVYMAGSTFTINADITLYAGWINAGDKDEPDPLTPDAKLLTRESWAELLKTIQTNRRYTALDLSGWTMNDTEFDARPGAYDAGESFIVSLILPGAATSIKNGWNSTTNRDENENFKHFTCLARVEGGSITTIGSRAFYGCTGLTTVDFPEAEHIENYAFAGCTGLTEMSFPEAASIGDSAFAGCTRLTTVDFPEAESIGQSAFWLCTALTTAGIPEAESIGENAFYGCTSLTGVNFPQVESIEAYTFADCTGLTTVDIPKTASIGQSAFAGCSGLTEVGFPETTSIGNSAFAGCTSLTGVSFPKVESIGQSAFGHCTRLTGVDFSKVTSIGDYAFERCTALTEVSFPKATSIGAQAFAGCTGLTEIDFSKAASIGDYAFYNTGSGALTVILPQTAPTLKTKTPYDSNPYAKTVTVKTPADRPGYNTAWQMDFKKLFGNNSIVTLTFEDLPG